MSDTDTKPKAKPAFNILIAREYGPENDRKTHFTKIGALFAHKSGNGFNGVLEAAPLNGRFVVLPYKEKDDGPGGQDEPN